MSDENTTTTTTTKASTSTSTSTLKWDGGYAWVNVAACIVLLASTWGLAIGYSVSLSYYATTTNANTTTVLGTSFLNVVAISGLQTSQALVIFPLGSWLLLLLGKTQRGGGKGMRYLTLLGILVQTTSLVGASFAAETWQFYLGQGVGFGWGIGLLMVPSQLVIPQWFSDRRGSLASCTAGGIGVGGGGLVWSYLGGYLFDRFGFGWGIRGLALVSGLLMTATAVPMLRDRGDDVLGGPRFGGGRRRLLHVGGLFCRPTTATTTSCYGWLLLYSFVMILADMAILTQMTTYGAAVLELSSGQLGTLSVMAVLGQIVGRPCIGYASDRMGRINVAIGVSFLAGVLTLAVWVNTYSFGLLVFYVICLGALAGVWWSLIGPITVDIMGLGAYPDAISVVFLSLVVPSAVSPLISLKLAESHQGYLAVQIYAGILFLAATVIGFFLRNSAVIQKQKRREHSIESEGNEMAIPDNCSGKMKLPWGIEVI